MSPPKKTWLNSMFSQLAHPENDNLPKRKKYNNPSTSSIIAQRKASNVHPAKEIINLEVEQDRDSKTGDQISNGNWADFFSPRCRDELALHPKKLQELHQWLQNSTVQKKPVQLCLLSGPSGSGKTTAVRVLAKENNISIREWINPVDQEIIYNLGDQRQEYVSSQVDAFSNFLFKASRYRSLLDITAANKSLILVEDFPNFILKDPTSFQDILEDYVNYAKAPLIFIVTDAKTRGLNISYNVFTEQIKKKFFIHHISFNSVAPTIMQKSMRRFCTLMRSPTYCHLYKAPSQDIVDSIVISAQGDIRNALTNFHFSSLRGAPKILTKRLENLEKSKTSKKRKCENKLKSLGRDESITMMHALGRIFNPKFTESNRFVHTPEVLAETFTMEPKKLIDLIHTNYILHFRDIEYILEAADGLSLCDIMLNEYRSETLTLTGLNVGIRSVMVPNTCPATGWMPVKGQKRINLNSFKIPAKASAVLPDHHNISPSLYALDYEKFVNVILT